MTGRAPTGAGAGAGALLRPSAHSSALWRTVAPARRKYGRGIRFERL